MGNKSSSSTTNLTENYQQQSQQSASDNAINLNFAGATFQQDNSKDSSDSFLPVDVGGMLSGNTAGVGGGSGLLDINIERLDNETIAQAFEFAGDIYKQSANSLDDASERAMNAADLSASIARSTGEMAKEFVRNQTENKDSNALKIILFGSIGIAALLILK